MKLTACLIVKNESALLERCLKSLEGVDSIVVVDTGSTDDTVKIAKKYAKVYHKKWTDDFSTSRNYALSKSTGDWNIMIDADEYLPEGAVQKIRALLGDVHDGISVKLAWDASHSHKVPRIIKRGVKYIGKIHEYADCKNVKDSDIWWTYEKSPSHALDPDRNLRILLTDTDNPRSQFYLANEYWDKGNIELALKWYLEYLKHGTWRYEVADANLRIARCLWHLQRGDEARNYCLQAILGNPNFKEALSFMAEMSWEKEATVWRKFATIASNEDVLFIRGDK